MTKEEIKTLAIKQISKESGISKEFVRCERLDDYIDRCLEIAHQERIKASLGEEKQLLTMFFDTILKNRKNGYISVDTLLKEYNKLIEPQNRANE